MKGDSPARSPTAIPRFALQSVAAQGSTAIALATRPWAVVERRQSHIYIYIYIYVYYIPSTACLLACARARWLCFEYLCSSLDTLAAAARKHRRCCWGIGNRETGEVGVEECINNQIVPVRNGIATDDGNE